ncbi:MAG: hypothetical protein ACKPKO_45410, partial [Candidatus Fonsibacter sp.]
WARKLQRISLLNGAIDADVATPGKEASPKENLRVRTKPRTHQKVIQKGKRDSSRESSSTSLPKGPCYSCIKTGECTKTNCPYDHSSFTQKEQIKKALGHGNSGGREQSRDSSGSTGSRNGRGQGKGKGKREGNGKSAGAKTEDVSNHDGKKWCLAHVTWDWQERRLMSQPSL